MRTVWTLLFLFVVTAPVAAQTGVSFTTSADHNDSSVLSGYRLEAFPQSADPTTATPTSTRDLGRPTPNASNTIAISAPDFFTGLPDGTYVCYVVAYGPGGIGRSLPTEAFTIAAAPPPPAPPGSVTLVYDSSPSPADIVIYAADVATTDLHGAWAHSSVPDAAAGVALTTSDAGVATVEPPLATPTHYVETTFQALAGVKYRLWLRISAESASKWNDSLWVQFSGSVTAAGAAIYRTGTTSGLNVNMATCSTCVPSGWGWHDHAYWTSETGEIYFAATGPQAIRLQVREDGVRFDQIVISPSRYLTSAPGPAINDTTIVSKP